MDTPSENRLSLNFYDNQNGLNQLLDLYHTQPSECSRVCENGRNENQALRHVARAEEFLEEHWEVQRSLLLEQLVIFRSGSFSTSVKSIHWTNSSLSKQCPFVLIFITTLDFKERSGKLLSPRWWIIISYLSARHFFGPALLSFSRTQILPSRDSRWI